VADTRRGLRHGDEMPVQLGHGVVEVVRNHSSGAVGAVLLGVPGKVSGRLRVSGPAVDDHRDPSADVLEDELGHPAAL